MLIHIPVSRWCFHIPLRGRKEDNSVHKERCKELRSLHLHATPIKDKPAALVFKTHKHTERMNYMYNGTRNFSQIIAKLVAFLLH